MRPGINKVVAADLMDEVYELGALTAKKAEVSNEWNQADSLITSIEEDLCELLFVTPEEADGLARQGKLQRERQRRRDGAH
jgi:hypothetical protein